MLHPGNNVYAGRCWISSQIRRSMSRDCYCKWWKESKAVSEGVLLSKEPFTLVMSECTSPFPYTVQLKLKEASLFSGITPWALKTAQIPFVCIIGIDSDITRKQKEALNWRTNQPDIVFPLWTSLYHITVLYLSQRVCLKDSLYQNRKWGAAMKPSKASRSLLH